MFNEKESALPVFIVYEARGIVFFFIQTRFLKRMETVKTKEGFFVRNKMPIANKFVILLAIEIPEVNML